MTFFAFMLLGIISLTVMPISLMPDIATPNLKIQIDEPGYSSNDLEQLVVKPIKSELLQISELENIRTVTENGKATIQLKFNFETDMDYALIEVNEKLDRVVSILPKDIQRPKVLRYSSENLPLFFVNIVYPKNVSSKIDFTYFVENSIRKRLERNAEIAFIDVSGYVYPEIVIQPDIAKMKALKLKANDITNVIEGNNIQAGSFKIREGQYQYDILFETSLTNSKDVENLFIKTGESQIQLNDVAEISIKEKKRNGYYYDQRKEAISLAIINKADSKVSNIKAFVLSELQEIKKNNPYLEYQINQDQSELLDNSLNNLRSSLFIGAILAFIIVLLFIGNYKVSIVVGLVIPLTLLIGFLFLHLLNISINIISLSGLILSVGMIIDNSIIVIDNISQFKAKGYPLFEACYLGTYDILKPLFSSLLTTCSVFIPLIYFSGIAGALFYDQSITIVIGLVTSYMVSIIFLPTLYYVLNIDLNQNKKTFNVVPLYTKTFSHLFKYKRSFLIVSLLIPLFSTLAYFIIEKEKMPLVKYDDFFVNIDWNQNIGLEECKTRSVELVEHITNSNIELNALIGRQQFMFVNDTDGDEKKLNLFVKSISFTNSERLKQQISFFLNSKYPSSIFQFEKSRNPYEHIFADNQENLFLKVPEKSVANISEITKELNRVFPESKVSVPDLERVLKIKVDQAKLVLYDLDFNSLVEELKYLFGEQRAGFLRNTSQYVPIVFRGVDGEISNLLASTYLTNKNGANIPISNLVDINFEYERDKLFSDENTDYIPLSIVTNNETDIINYVTEKLNREITFGGAFLDQQTFINEFIFILVITVILLYFILAAQFESLIQPIIILLEIPITIGATIILMTFINVTLNVMSFIGIIIVLGIIINDSILKVDAINVLIRKGDFTLFEAIHQAGIKRVNAILMTSLTTIFAMTPIVFSSGIVADIQQPLGVVVIVSMLIGTIVSVYFVPFLFWTLAKGKLK